MIKVEAVSKEIIFAIGIVFSLDLLFHRRWGIQNGSVYLRDQKIPIDVPRVRNKVDDAEIPLTSYQKLQQPYMEDEQTFKKLLNGISMHKYRGSTELAPEVFGISPTNMSQRFKRATTAKLRNLQIRSLRRYDFVSIFIDGKRFAEEGIVIAVGITIEGEKIILGIEQMATENHRAVIQFFDKLIGRGLRFQEGLLFIVDGSKGIIKAINQKFQGYALLQRCQWHKRENVVSYLSKSQQAIWRRKLQAAYAKTTYAEAKAALMKLSGELEEINSSAAASLREGIEETLTIYKLKLSTELRKSFSSTNCIESIMAQVEQYTQRVDRWRNGEHIKRWVASGLLEVEPRLRKVNGWRYMNLLRSRIKEELELKQQEENNLADEQKLIQVGV
ncbi:MAG: transposase [Candidatus Omnitrophica bacterium]|nr:transposase [Candidatus Omnitrophota bacterium]MBU1523438.1 transposase [Candidatus Omnitrophota bacterium]